MAHWVGENLFKDGFAQAVVNGDANVGNWFLRVIDKVRRALGMKNSQSARNIANLERLFMQAIENKQGPRSGDVQYAFIGKLPDGVRAYETDMDLSLTTDEKKALFKKRIATIFNLGAVELKTDVKKLLVRGDKFTENKNLFGDKKATPDEMNAKYRMLYELADVLSTAQYDRNATEIEPSFKDPSIVPKKQSAQRC